MVEFIASLLVFLGAAFILISAIGLLRFKDLYCRMHATTKSSSFGVLLILAGVVLFFSSLLVALKAIAIIIIIYLTAPLAAHSIAKSALDTEKGDKADSTNVKDID